MLFQFDRVRSGDEGFWMVGVEVPLDIAFLDGDALILRILTMDLCQSELSASSSTCHPPPLPVRRSAAHGSFVRRRK